ncbi:tetratricopeptide repeat protein [Catellatospora vulcania]|uniref:tetratricopeptide repeat protein n=1 Tax=Catellatospora vulcania TaxID=1460450 RepID=UPI0018AFD6B3|nr:tetratricopeptide repeat protein [Catellatospora vulcania]
MWRRIIAVGVTAAALLGLGGAFGASSAPWIAEPAHAQADPLVKSIEQAQARLRDVPGDWTTWAALGSAYVERARITGDPGYYTRAEGALRESLRLHPAGTPSTGSGNPASSGGARTGAGTSAGAGDGTGNHAALTGLGALANARHDFTLAERLARQAVAANPFSADAYGVLTDALTQLGRPAEATEAAQRMLDLRPGLPALSRAAYDLEQHGRVDEARALWTQALATAIAPADLAFVHHQLGDLAWHGGDLTAARAAYQAGLSADGGYLPLRHGLARVDAASGRTGEALAGYAALTAASPTPSLLVEHALLLRSLGRADEAETQLALAQAALDLLTAGGGGDALAAAELALARGDHATAVRLAEGEWRRRRHTDVADTLAWALHQAGRPAEALPLARAAAALGARSALHAYHLGMIELALGDRAAARRDLARALRLNPHFSPVDAPAAARALASAGA